MTCIISSANNFDVEASAEIFYSQYLSKNFINT